MVLGTYSRKDRLYDAAYSVISNGDLAEQPRIATGRLPEGIASLAAASAAAEPPVPREPEHARARQTLAHAERAEQIDQVAKPDTAAVRRQRVPPYRHDQGRGARRDAREGPTDPAGNRRVRRGCGRPETSRALDL